MSKRNRRIIYFNKRRALFKIAVLIISIFAFLPSSYLETNFENYGDSNSKDLALQAVKSTSNTSNKLLDQLLIVSYKIESIDEEDGELVSSVITAYTVFGIPYAEIIVYPEGAYVKKNFL